MKRLLLSLLLCLCGLGIWGEAVAQSSHQCVEEESEVGLTVEPEHGTRTSDGHARVTLEIINPTDVTRQIRLLSVTLIGDERQDAPVSRAAIWWRFLKDDTTAVPLMEFEPGTLLEVPPEKIGELYLSLDITVPFRPRGPAHEFEVVVELDDGSQLTIIYELRDARRIRR